MAEYRFTTAWRAAAPIDRVFDAIADVEQWPTWWPGVRAVQLLERGAEDGVGTAHRFVFRSRLPYSLAFAVRVREVRRPVLLAGDATGELAGTGTWLLRDGDGSTHIRYEWNVRTTRWWMNVLAPLARGAFERNHDVVMEWGRIGLASRLGAPVEVDES